MSRAARRQSSHRRIQPYTWLGAGAVTLGMGAAMVGGAAAAFADTGNDAGAESRGATTESRGAAAGSVASKSTASLAESSSTRKKAVRANRGPAAASAGTPSATSSPASSAASVNGRLGRVATTPEIPEVAPAAAVLPQATTPAPAAVEPMAAQPAAPIAAAATAPVETSPDTPKRLARTARTAAVVPAPPAVQATPAIAERPAVTAPAAAVPGPAADPAPEMTSWLPGGSNPGAQIVPGAHVELALQEIADAQGIITQQTWGSGNVFAGVAAILPQVLLAGAALSLQAWAATNAGVQDLVAGTAGIPLIHQIAQVTLLTNMLLPTVAEASMGGAELFLPLVSLFGADVGAAQAQVASAQDNGKVYAVVPVRMVATTQPVVGVSVNGGSNATLLVDSGASGLVTTRDRVGSGDLGAPIGAGSSCFSGGLCYDYTTYSTTVDLGSGAVTTAPVNIVDADDEQEFKDFFAWGADGILGTGANTAGPGPAAIPTALMPGELSNGVLLYQNAFFGLGGVMVLGPNPLPTRVSVPGAPDAFVAVSVNGGAPTSAGAIIDSGGVYGTLNTANDTTGTPVGSNLPAGTVIDVYTADGATLLYSYTTQSGQRGTPVIAAGLFNTGNAPFAQSPIYLDYGFDEPYGIGSTDFSIW